MTRHFQNEIQKLKKMILHLSAMVEGSLEQSIKALINRDSSFADKIKAIDIEIDKYEVEVEEECLKILALHQPVAADLRFVVAVLKINNDLERIGDLSVNIAKRIKHFELYSDKKVPFDMVKMLTVTSKMVKDASDALVAWDAGKAKLVLVTDNIVDAIHKEAYKEIQRLLKEESDAVPYYISLLSVSRNIERIADHATNIAEDIIYMVSGEIIRHHSGDE